MTRKQPHSAAAALEHALLTEYVPGISEDHVADLEKKGLLAKGKAHISAPCRPIQKDDDLIIRNQILILTMSPEPTGGIAA